MRCRSSSSSPSAARSPPWCRSTATSTDEAVNWMAAWALLQGCAFSGIGAAGAAATDLENGFFDRIRLAPVPTTTVLAGLLGYCGGAVPASRSPAVLIVSFVFLDARTCPVVSLGIAMTYFSGAGLAIVMSLLALSGRIHRQEPAVARPRPDRHLLDDVPVGRPSAAGRHRGLAPRRGGDQPGHPGHPHDPPGVPRRCDVVEPPGPAWSPSPA